MACGVLGLDGQWHTPTRKPDFLFPVQALSKVFRAKFMAALACAHRDDCIPRDPQGQDALWRERRRQLYKHDWVVYAIAGDCGAGRPWAIASTRWHGVASEPGATLRPYLNVTNHQGIAGI